MSLQHYAILAAVSYHKNHHIQNAMTTSVPPRSTIPTNTTAVPSSVVNFLNNKITSESTITTYYGSGLGLFHQQNIRSNSYGGSDGSIGGKSANNKYPNSINGNVNLLLGGAMLSVVTTILCVVCYCCHRNIKKRTEAAYRQQRQWQENDPGMEIYSVEQCYETSGLFLGESIDGLTTLSHEPPPSYDAVVTMQEQQRLMRQQQQQQLLLQQDELVQRNSPPPGYRSSLDVSTMVISSCSHNLPANENMAIYNSNENLTNSDNLFRQERRNNRKHLATASATINMKKVFNAQSCCSLQRAEVENMWNAAAAAVVARAGQIQTIVITGADSEPDVTATAVAVPSSKKSMLNYAHGVIGRHYLNQNDYRRGCPLCGKFRYDAEDESSQDGGAAADDMVAAVTLTSAYMDTYNGNQSKGIVLALDNEKEPPDESLTFSDIECSCTNHKNDTNTDKLMNHAVVSTDQIDSNGNDINSIVLNDGSEFYVEDAQDDDIVLEANFVNNNANTTISMVTAAEDTETDCAAAEAVEDRATVSIKAAAVNLDSINDNGIIRLDMSKIIDNTGLPNYDAALKLESSGYV